MGTEWKRLSVTFKADVPQDGFWPNPHYLVQFEGTVPFLLDAVAVCGPRLHGAARRHV